ncbi:putative ferrichrome transport ATP-binding protein FhuC [delta proteobacterium NaphS2]|nr:putative ferrichrome transport ATP-binding protein FhuC [delta proteobacterium NaphS2]
MKSSITAKSLHASYDSSSVLKNVSFSVEKGEFFILIGPNGSGKTMLLRILSRTLPLESGTLDIEGIPMDRYSRRALARIIALVPQSVPEDLPFTVRELVLMARSPRMGLLGLERDHDIRHAEEAMAFTQVENLTERKMDQLSGGERQRVFIARAICQEPEIILLDEPTAALDLAHQVRIMDLMEKLREEKGLTVIMVSHDINLAAMYGNRLMLLKKGRIVKLGRPAEVLTFETLEETYECPLLVGESPLGDFQQVTLVPKKFIREDLQAVSKQGTGPINDPKRI